METLLGTPLPTSLCRHDAAKEKVKEDSLLHSVQ